MLREVGKIYSRAFRMIFQHPQFLLLSVGFELVNRLNSYIASQLRTLNAIGMRCAALEISLFGNLVSLAIFIGVPLAFILMVYRIERGDDLKDVFQQTKQNFWKFVRQSFAGFLLALAYTLPVFCLALFSVFMDSALFVTIFIPSWLLVFGFLGYGSISLGQRILLDNRQGSFQNSLRGFRILNGNFLFFATIYLIDTLISVFFFPFRYAIGSLVTGVDLFSVPISSFSLFLNNIYTATQTPLVYVWDFIYGLIILPFFAIIPTLAYLRFKDFDASRFSRRRTLTTEN